MSVKTITKLAAVFLAGALLLSCSRASEPKMQKVVFYAGGIETGDFTRSVDHNEILSTIADSYLTFPIDLYTNEENNQYIRMEFGRTYTVPVGTFRVTGYNTPTMTAQPTNKYQFAKSPLFYTSSYVTIEYGTTEYSIPIEVRSAAIVYDKSEISKVEFQGQTGSYISMTDSDFVFSDHYGIFFINGYFEGNGRVYLRVTPKTGANKVTEFIFCADEVATGGSTYAHLEMGKYYVLHPNPVTELGGISFVMDVPSWECTME